MNCPEIRIRVRGIERDTVIPSRTQGQPPTRVPRTHDLTFYTDDLNGRKLARAIANGDFTVEYVTTEEKIEKIERDET